MRKHFWWILVAALALIIAGCAAKDTERSHVGEGVTVHLRGDALGLSSSTPISLNGDKVNGATVSVHGKLKAIDTDFVTVEADREWQIPRESVLAISFDGSK